MVTAFTSGQIADAIGEPVYTVQHVLKRDRIEHVGKWGNRRLFDPSVVEQVSVAIRIMRSRQRRHFTPLAEVVGNAE